PGSSASTPTTRSATGWSSPRHEYHATRPGHVHVGTPGRPRPPPRVRIGYRRMNASETVKVTVDGVLVEVPKGTGLVETALAAGIEIPVFCYEPRLGAPVGACRMCLCEVEGMPK